MKLRPDQRHISYDNAALAWLSLAAGCTDVLAFLRLGDLFTSAMTGNVALLAIAIGRGQLLTASRSVTALLGFALGVVLAAALNASGRALPDVRGGVRRLLLLELIFLLGGAALWSARAELVGGTTLYAVIVLSAVSMGIQAVAARSINSSGISTVVFTTALIHIAMSATRALAPPAAPVASLGSTRSHLGTLAAYGCGAALAGFLVSRHLFATIWVPTAAVIAALGFSELPSKAEGSARECLEEGRLGRK
jgi:uncharacterized membrane protein YoaK (UPF0700 family)